MVADTGRTFIRRRGNTVIPNATVYDDALSFGALGVLVVLLSRPDRAPKGYRSLMGRGMGERAVRAALRELDAAGYRHQVKRRGPAGRFVTDTVVSEDRITPDVALAYVEQIAPLDDVDVPHDAAPDDAPRGADRADTPAARSDLHKDTETAGRTVRRATAPRSTAPRSHTASLRAKVSSLRSETGDTKSAQKPNDDDVVIPAPPTPDYLRARDELRAKIAAERRRERRP